MNITAVIMCSGFGKRMGYNKLLMDFRGRRMFEYIIDTVRSCSFYKTLVVTAYDEIADYSKGLCVIKNTENIEGISASIRLGVNNCGACNGIMFFTADQPFLDKQTVEKIIKAFENKGMITVPTVNGATKNPVIFPASYKNELLLLKGDNGGKAVYNKHLEDVDEVCFENGDPFLDVDREGDKKKFQKNSVFPKFAE